MGIIILRDGKILIGERVGNHGSGTFMIPGGHLELGESFEAAAKREGEEETGLTDLMVRGLVSIGNDVAYGKHYISIVMLAESHAGDPYDAEPEKSQSWKWYDVKDIPENIFIPSKKAIANWLVGEVYSDGGTAQTPVL